MRMRDILHTKGGHVYTIDPDRTVHEAMQTMVRREIGCLVVKEADAIRGIITERDILKFTARRPDAVGGVLVREVMTGDVVIGAMDDEVNCVMNLMTRNKIRHLPVVDQGDLVGIVSIGDLVNAVRCDVELENRYMHDYIAGVVA